MITQVGDKPLQNTSTKPKPGFEIAKESPATIEQWVHLVPERVGPHLIDSKAVSVDGPSL